MKVECANVEPFIRVFEMLHPYVHAFSRELFLTASGPTELVKLRDSFLSLRPR